MPRSHGSLLVNVQLCAGGDETENFTISPQIANTQCLKVDQVFDDKHLVTLGLEGSYNSAEYFDRTG